MKKDQTQDNYKEITQDLKKDKMDWDFDKFLEQTKKTEKTIPLVKKTKGGTIPNIFWLAASVAVVLSIGIVFNYQRGNTVDQKNKLVQNEILKQKDTFHQEAHLAINTINDSLKIKSDSIMSDSVRTVEQMTENDLMDQIIPRRGRINRNARQRFADVAAPKDKEKSTVKTPKYESSYVIINGQKIENEQEAIDLTKYSFRILSENVSKTVAQTEIINSFNND